MKTEKIKQLLHVGCGYSAPNRLPKHFQEACWNEIRLDIDPAVQPDIIGSITDLSMVANSSVDAVWSSHSIEHIHSFEVAKALAELRRVLKSDGYLLMTLPNLRAIAHCIVADQLTDKIYDSAAGAISPLDVIFGHQASLANGHTFMAHKTGFTAKSLADAMFGAGFHEVRVLEGDRWDLWAIGMMPETSKQIFEELAEVML